MRGISAGARVWIKEGEQKHYGIIESIAVTQGFFGNTASMVIRMDDGHKVLATATGARGTMWDLVTPSAKEKQA